MLFTGGQHAMNKVKLNTRQKQLLDHIKSLIASYRPQRFSFFSHPILYLSDKFSRRFLNKQGNDSEASLLVTEEVRSYIIQNSLSLDDLVIVSDQTECNNNEMSFLYRIFLNLVSLIAHQNQTNQALSQEHILHPEDSTFSGISNHHTFNPQLLEDYIIFVQRYLNNSNTRVLCNEALKTIYNTSLLTPQSVLLRGLALAILSIANNNGYDFPLTENAAEQLKIEYCTAVSLILTALTTNHRDHTLSTLREDFAREHPNIDRFINFAGIVNANVLALSFGYVMGILCGFATRTHSEYAVDRSRDDVKVFTKSNFTVHKNRTLYVQYRNNYTQYRNNTDHLLQIYNNSSFNNGTVVFAPEHSSEYFPEYAGIINGIPAILTTIVSATQLFCALPATMCGEMRNRYILDRLSQNSLTSGGRHEDLHLMGSMIFRWVGNVAVQPSDLITHDIKDTALKFSIFRFFLPSSFIEEPAKLQSVANALARSSYRSRKKVLLRPPYMYTSFAITLVLEYVGASLNKTLLVAGIKALRPLSLLMALCYNRGRVLYSRSMERYICASLTRLTSSLVVLPMFDLLGDKLRYLSLATGIDVVLSVYADIVCGQVMDNISTVQLNIATIQDLIDDSIQQNRSHIFIMPLAERGYLRHMSQLTVEEMMALLNEEVRVMEEEVSSSPSIREVTDEEAEQIIREQNACRSRRQQRSDLNAPEQPEGATGSCCPSIELCFTKSQSTKKSSSRTTKSKSKKSSTSNTPELLQLRYGSYVFSTHGYEERSLEADPRNIPMSSEITEDTPLSSVVVESRQEEKNIPRQLSSVDLSSIIRNQATSSTRDRPRTT
ncbi:Cpg1 family polymorphic protein [Ehrlichia ruminantium]|uniref:Cpg1 family polymorphic protein n=1 Tax=Ehrlichia ruminantium TaxID=779 RepID=UPI001FC7CBD0|nr:hypothetical protein [Ehrlichia ruminantium]UOD98129.1 hypothetical protein IMW64_01380 [Ehrlichia ruminantium]